MGSQSSPQQTSRPPISIPTEPESGRHPAVRAAWAFDKWYLRGYHHLDAHGTGNIPHIGPVILVGNHISGLDPFALQAVCPRIIVWMMAREFYEQPIINPFYRLIGVIPVERNGRDLASVRLALRALEKGRVLGIFPEGRINEGESLLPFQTGVALLAMRSLAPLVPFAIQGDMRGRELADSFLLPARLTIRLGSPMVVSPGDGLEQTMQRIHDAVVNLTGPD